MTQRLFKLWIEIGYAAFMVGAKKGAKAQRWYEGLKYMFNTYYFFLLIAIIGNILISIFPNGLSLVGFLIIFGTTAIYVYGYSKTYDKLIDKLNYDPSINYKKNTRKEIIAFVLFVISKIIIIPLYVLSFVIQNYI